MCRPPFSVLQENREIPKSTSSLKMRHLLSNDKGAAFFMQTLVAVLILAVVSTALVRNIWQSHDQALQEYRRLRAISELQNEMEYWKAQIFVNGPNVPAPNSRRKVILDSGRRTKRQYVLGEFDPAPTIRQLAQPGMTAYEITVSISWPEGNAMRRESLMTAINQRR
jgi:hypothetical protein